MTPAEVAAPTAPPLVTMQTKLAVSLVLVALCCWLALRPASRSGPGSIAPIDAPTADVPRNAAADLGAPLPAGTTVAARAEAATDAAAATPVQASAPPTPELEPVRDLAVRVVDATGAPIVGATVVIWSGDGGAAREVLSEQTMEPDGEVRFVNLAAEVDRSWGNSKSIAVGLELAGETKIVRPLDADALPVEPVVLVAPAHGRLDVRFVDAAGAPYLLDEWVHLTPYYVDPLQPRDRRRGARIGAYPRQSATASFPIVEPGVELRFEVYENGIRRGVERELEPFAPGEVRAIEVVLGETLPHVIGRIVDEAGAPIPVYSVDVEFEPDGRAVIRGIGADGSFALSVARLRDATDEFAALIRAELQGPGSKRHEVQRLSGRFVARVPRDSTPVNVGVVVLRAAPVILTGRIVDAEGAPIEEAYISVYEKANQRSDSEAFTWSFASVDYAHSDPDGLVVVQGDLPVGEYAARAHAAGWIDRGAQRFPLGARGLEFVLDRAHFIRGRVRLPEGTRLEDLEVVLRNEGASREWHAYANWRTGLAADGSFLLANVRPDVVSLALKRVDSAATLAVIEGVAPTSTDDRIQPNLDPWDLTAGIVQVSTRVHLADGRPAPVGLVSIGKYGAPIEAGRCDAAFERDAGNEVLMVAPGHIPARFSLGAVPERVDLVQGTRVEVSLAAPVPNFPEGWSLELALRPVRFSFVPEDGFVNTDSRYARPVREGMWSERVDVRPGQTAWTLHVPEPGRYSATWHLRRPNPASAGGSGPSQQLRRRPEHEALEVERVPGTALTFGVVLDRDALEESVEALRNLER